MSTVSGGSGGASDDDHISAAEYVIGTLNGDERAAFAQRLAADGGAQAAVRGWERRLARLDAATQPVEPPATLWATIERTIGSAPKTVPFRVIEGGRRDSELDGRPADFLLRSRNRWRTAALASGLVAAALIAFMATRLSDGSSAAPNGTYVAAVNRGGDKPALIVSVDLRTRRVIVRPIAAGDQAGHSLELWYVNEGSAPKSMGLVKAGPLEMALPPDLRADARTTIAVSLEPEGGSKTDAPTGPVLYSGQLVEE